MGKLYVAVSAGLLPATFVACWVLMAGFRERGSQSAGAGPFALALLALLGAVALNALVAGILAWAAPSTRPTLLQTGLATGILTALGLLLVLGMRMSSR